MSNLCADIIGGHDVTSMRAAFDPEDKNVVVASTRQLFYYNVDTCKQAGRTNLDPKKLQEDEIIVSFQFLGNHIYIFTNKGRLLIWDHETRNWLNEIFMPIESEFENLIACKMLSKRQYFFTVHNKRTQATQIFNAFSKSERERPKRKIPIGNCYPATSNSFDFGSISNLDEDPNSPDDDPHPSSKRTHFMVYGDGRFIHLIKLSINLKLNSDSLRLSLGTRSCTCIRANPRQPVFAVGDDKGRIFLYTGDMANSKLNRTKLHWHSLPVNDICFSSTGKTMFSVGGESGCVVIWDLDQNTLGQNRVVARLGMPIRFINCSNSPNLLALSFEDNEIQIMDTSNATKRLETFTRSTLEMYLKNDQKALRVTKKSANNRSIGLCWHSKSDTLVVNSKTGHLQFYSPQERLQKSSLNLLQSNILSLEAEGQVIPSDITKAALTYEGRWLALYETRQTVDMFPCIRLHIWQLAPSSEKWIWVQTAERLHSSPNIEDLSFSPDGKFLVSVSDDGTFKVLHKVCLDTKMDTRRSKYMFAIGYSGKVAEKLPAKAAFSRDSSVMALGLKNNATSIWMIVDPYKLVYECQLNHNDDGVKIKDDQVSVSRQRKRSVLGLRFGKHKSSEAMAPLVEVRSNSIRIWNILNPQETVHYSIGEDSENDSDDKDTFVAVAFDYPSSEVSGPEFFATCTHKNLIMIFKLEIARAPSKFCPLIVIDGSLPYPTISDRLQYTSMSFMSKPILDIDPQCHQDPCLVKLISRLCMMNSNQELIALTDKLTYERGLAADSYNDTKAFDMKGLQAYFAESVSTYQEEVTPAAAAEPTETAPIDVTEKQRRIRTRLQVQKMLKDLLAKIPSQKLPSIDVLGPMILDKLI